MTFVEMQRVYSNCTLIHSFFEPEVAQRLVYNLTSLCIFSPHLYLSLEILLTDIDCLRAIAQALLNDFQLPTVGNG